MYLHGRSSMLGLKGLSIASDKATWQQENDLPLQTRGVRYWHWEQSCARIVIHVSCIQLFDPLAYCCQLMFGEFSLAPLLLPLLREAKLLALRGARQMSPCKDSTCELRAKVDVNSAGRCNRLHS